MSQMTEQFLDYLRLERNYSPKTVEVYRKDLLLFEEFFTVLEGHPTWETVDADIIRDWMGSMMDKGNTASSINRRLSAVRSFYRFALKHGLVDSDPAHQVTGPKKKKVLPVFIPETLMKKLLDEYEWKDNYHDVLARTLLIILYETGMRRSEVTGLDKDDADMLNRQFKVTGKSDKQRLIPFGARLAETLERYMEKRRELPADNSTALLVSSKGNRLDPEQVYNIVKTSLGLVTTQKKRSPHVLRHTFATSMLNHDAGLESVQKLLGHESLKTTEVYTHTTFEQLKRVYELAHPRKE